jgi:hypothetical protein
MQGKVFVLTGQAKLADLITLACLSGPILKLSQLVILIKLLYEV